MARTNNFRLIQDYTIPAAYSSFTGDFKVLEAGSYVRPIEYMYVPIHVIDDKRWKYFDKILEVFCHTKYGLIPLPWSYLRSE